MRNFTLSPGKAISVDNKKIDSQGILESLFCRGDRIRTCDPLVPNQMRYQLRYTPNNGSPKALFYRTLPVNNDPIFKLSG